MYTGTGGPNTDIGAHLFGFIAGFAAGLVLIRLGNIPKDTRSQLIAGVIAFGLIFFSWAIALVA